MVFDDIGSMVDGEWKVWFCSLKSECGFAVNAYCCLSAMLIIDARKNDRIILC